MQAARFEDGKLVEKVSLQDAAQVLASCEDAAEAARRAPTRSGALASLRRQWHAVPTLVAAAAGLGVKAGNLFISADSLSAIAAVSGAAVPLALIAAGASLATRRPSALHWPSACRLLAMRAGASFALSTAVLLLIPQSLAYVMASGALLVCLASPISSVVRLDAQPL